jgi:hypothetical protein
MEEVLAGESTCTAVFNDQGKAVAGISLITADLACGALLICRATSRNAPGRSCDLDVRNRILATLASLRASEIIADTVTDTMDAEREHGFEPCSANDTQEILWRRAFFNTPMSLETFERIWALLNDDEAECRASGHSPLISLTCVTPEMIGILQNVEEVVDAPWVFPPMCDDLNNDHILLVSAADIPLVSGKRFLMRFHLKLLLVAMWWDDMEDPLFLNIPGFQHGMALIDAQPPKHRFELRPASLSKHRLPNSLGMSTSLCCGRRNEPSTSMIRRPLLSLLPVELWLRLANRATALPQSV